MVSPAPSAIGVSSWTAANSSSDWKRPIAQFIDSDAARESSVGASPGLYLPVSTPCASGDQTIWEMPCSSQKGISSASGARQIIEYCGWDETHFFMFGTWRP